MSVSDTTMFNGKKIEEHLNNDVAVHFYESIDSTNNEAKRCFENQTTPMLFVANHQTGGRGRLGRTFYSPQNTGLYMSLMLKQNGNFDDVVCLTTATAVCVCDALKQLCDINPQIKWVNDIYIENKKVCGILCEAITNEQTHQIDAIVIGIGINITTDDFPPELFDIATSINKNLDRAKLCALITDNIISVCTDLSSRDFITKYKDYSLVLNREITYTENGISKTATAIDIDRNGGLVIKTDNTIKTLSTGEITVRFKND